MGKGWIKVYRQIYESAIWVTDEPFDHRSAWIDLIMMANIKTKKTIYKGSAIEIKKGQICTSIRKLADRWHWSIGKTRRFIKLLQDLDMVRHETWHTGGTLLTIVKYNDFQGMRHTDEHSDEHTDRYTDEHSGGYSDGRLLKNDKKDKKLKEGAAPISIELAAPEDDDEEPPVPGAVRLPGGGWDYRPEVKFDDE